MICDCRESGGSKKSLNSSHRLPWTVYWLLKLIDEKAPLTEEAEASFPNQSCSLSNQSLSDRSTSPKRRRVVPSVFGKRLSPRRAPPSARADTPSWFEEEISKYRERKVNRKIPLLSNEWNSFERLPLYGERRLENSSGHRYDNGSLPKFYDSRKKTPELWDHERQKWLEEHRLDKENTIGWQGYPRSSPVVGTHLSPRVADQLFTIAKTEEPLALNANTCHYNRKKSARSSRHSLGHHTKAATNPNPSNRWRETWRTSSELPWTGSNDVHRVEPWPLIDHSSRVPRITDSPKIPQIRSPEGLVSDHHRLISSSWTKELLPRTPLENMYHSTSAHHLPEVRQNDRRHPDPVPSPKLTAEQLLLGLHHNNVSHNNMTRAFVDVIFCSVTIFTFALTVLFLVGPLPSIAK